MILTIVIGLVVVLGCYALIEPYWVQASEHMVEVPGLPEPFDGFTILHLSDIHGRVGFFSGRRFREWRRKADMVAITGDLYSPTLSRARLARRLDTLRAPAGVFYISGNHDYRHGRLSVEPWQPEERLLDNRVRAIERGGATLLVTGLPDFVKGLPDWDKVRRELLDKSAPVILLAHRPDAWLLPGVERVSLILAGHTHGGQVTIPGIGAPLKHNHVPGGYVAGRLDAPNKPVLITSRGLGTSELPIRFLARPEIILIHLVKSKTDASRDPNTTNERAQKED